MRKPSTGETKHIVSFSGGKDSTAMLLMMLDKGMPVDRIVFIDTGLEFPEIYSHIRQVEQYIHMPIERYPFSFGEGLRKRGWPHIRLRWCTGKKMEIFAKVKSKNDKTYIGIAYDEIKRAKPKPNFVYPLVQWKVTEAEALQYCYARGFDFEGIYKHIKRASCFACPFQRISELRYIYNKKPELWDQIVQMDKDAQQARPGQPYNNKYTVTDLSERFAKENLTPDLFGGTE